jgi:hypothetical protein
MKGLSIGSRVTLGYLGIFLLAEVIFGASMYVMLRKNIFDIADSVIEGQVADLQRFLGERQHSSPAQLQSEVAAEYEIERSQDCLQIADASGNLIYRSPLLAEHPLPAVSFADLDRPVYENRRLGPGRFRFLSRQMDVSGRVYLVRVGHPMQVESEALADFRAYSFCLGLLLLLGASVAGYWLNRRALARIDLLRPQ